MEGAGRGDQSPGRVVSALAPSVNSLGSGHLDECIEHDDSHFSRSAISSSFTGGAKLGSGTT